MLGQGQAFSAAREQTYNMSDWSDPDRNILAVG
jgi:hypothetical protein